MYDPDSPLVRDAPPSSALPRSPAKARFAEDRLLDAVIWCEIQPGERVTEAEVMRRFGLTRAASRAALARLGYDGWARPFARLGWEILPVTGALVGHVLSARAVVEPAALAAVRLTDTARQRVREILAVLEPVRQSGETGATRAFDEYADEIDSLLLAGTDDFTAGHLRRLWQHTARMTRHLGDASPGGRFERGEVFALADAVLQQDAARVRAARLDLIEAQRAFFLRQMLKNDATLGPGSGPGRRPPETNAAFNGRPT